MLLQYSTSPHIRINNTTKKIMINVCIALLPACVMGVIFFGVFALLTILVSVISAIFAELLYQKMMGLTLKDAINSFDYSSVVTGIIIALILPVNVYLYIPILASVFAIIFCKMIFGGTGNNFANPAVTGRIFVFISFSSILNTYVLPSISAINAPVITGATSLQSFLKDGSSLSLIDLFLGTGVAGCIGETCKVAILVGAIYLAIKKIIKIWLPFLTLLFAGATAVMLNGFNLSVFLPAILSGGIFFGAFFMATDYVTNPITISGQVIFFALFGVLTSILRQFTGFETASFALLIMNILVPLIDKLPVRKPFGYKKIKGDK